MYDWHIEDREWVQVPSGNYCCNDGDHHVATVFRNKWGNWGIIITDEPYSKLVRNELFEDAQAAMKRADEILDGAEYSGMKLLPKFY